MGIEFSDITLVPRVISNIESRDGGINTSLKFGNIVLSIPIFASPMKDVCDGALAKKIRVFGGIGIIHRFMGISEQVAAFALAEETVCAIGVSGDSFDRFKTLFEVGCKRFCVDTANAANTRVGKVIEELGKYEGVELVVGNVASKECYKWLTQWPCVKGIRVGIAGGAACTTKNATGVYHGMVSCIRECAEVKNNGCALIADGGIKEPQDFCKAIACGADAIMMGSLIAATFDSPAEIINMNGVKYKRYHGSASFEIQKEYRDKPRYIEGRTRMLDYDGQTLEELMIKFADGLRSSMSYFNARNFSEYRRNITFS